MTPEPNSSLLIYDQNFNGLGETIEAFNKNYEDERITRSKGKEIFTFQVLSTSAIYKHLKVENIVEFGGRWFRIKYLEDDDSIKGLTTFTCYALWYELAEGMPTSLSIAASNLQAVATQILQPFGKWTKLVIPTALQSKSVRGVTLKENSGLYQLRYLAKQYELELTFGYEVVIENELRYVKTVVFLQQYAQSKLDFPLIVEENLRHIAKTEDSRNLVTAYKLTGKSENDEEEFTFASINNGSPYLVDTSWFNRLGVKPRIIPKSKQDDRFTVKQNMLDAARQFLDIYAKPLITYEAGAILYSAIPDLHDSQLVIDDTYDILEWRRVSSRKLNYDDLTSSTIVFDDPRQNLMDLLNDDGDGALSYQENETARPIIRFADDVLGTNMNDTSGKYIGVITTKKPVEQLTPDDFTWVLIEGPRGLAGPPGQQGPPGRDGVDGIAGRDGVGITATDITYFLSTSGITTPTSGWTSSVPALVKGRYLWTRTIWTYSDGQRETGYQVTYIAQDGNSGRDGLPGKDGVGITSTATTYARSTSGTSAPISGWTSSVPTVPPGEFLWTRTIWTYSDRTTETGYSVAKMGDTGPKGEKGDPGRDGLPGAAGVGIRSTVSTYGLSSSETTQPTAWSATVPTLVKGQYLWTKNVWTYTDGRTETGYSKTYIPRDGNNGTNGIAGKDGVGIRSTAVTYAASLSGTAAPGSGWSANVPNVTPGQYLWSKTVWTYTDNTTETGYSVARMGADGTDAAINITCGFTQGYADSFTSMNKGIGSITPLSDGWARFLYTNSTTTAQRVEFSLPKPEGLTENQLYTFILEFRNNKSNFRGLAYFVQDNRSAFWGNLNNHATAYIDQSLVRFSRVPQTNTISLAQATCLAVVNINTIPNQVLDVEFRISAYVGDYKGAYIPYMGGKVGPRGNDGKNAYMHFAYSDNANGVPFSHTDTGQRYQGYYSDNTQSHSGNAASYTWTDRWAKITETTGNLLLRSNEPWSSTAYLAKEYEIAEPLEEGKTYSFVIHWWRGSGVSSNYVPMIYYNGGALMLAAPTGTTIQQEAPTKIKYDSEIDSWVVTFTVKKRSQMGEAQLQNFDTRPPKLRVYRFGSDTPDQNDGANSSAQSNASFATLVKGNIPMSKWQPHWSELQNQINSKADHALTQEQINMLAEKNTLMQAELEAKLSMERFSDLEKAYKAYVDENNANVQKSEKDLIEAVRRIGEAEEVLGGLAKTKRFIDTYIKETNEGIVIGTQDNVSQIRVSHNRIAMYSAGKEVMYISQGVIHIDNGVFTKSLQIGRFRTEQHHTNLDMNVCRYVG